MNRHILITLFVLLPALGFAEEDWKGARDTAAATLKSMEAEWDKLQGQLRQAQQDYNKADAEATALIAQIKLNKGINTVSNTMKGGKAATTPNSNALREALEAGPDLIEQKSSAGDLEKQRDAALARMSEARNRFAQAQQALDELSGRFYGVKERLRALNGKLGLPEDQLDENNSMRNIDRTKIDEFEVGKNDDKAEKKEAKRNRDGVRTANNRGVRPPRVRPGGDCGKH